MSGKENGKKLNYLLLCSLVVAAICLTTGCGRVDEESLLLQSQEEQEVQEAEELERIRSARLLEPRLNAGAKLGDRLGALDEEWSAVKMTSRVACEDPGTHDYCQEACPCGDTLGDCDSDAECEEGHYCAHNVGDQYGYAPDIDVCLAYQGCHTSLLGQPDYCSVACPCNDGEGDCDSDAECNNGYCEADVGDQYGFGANIDVCIAYVGCHTSVNGAADYCSVGCPCGNEEGDCDSTSECLAGFKCEMNVGATYGFSALTDVCLPITDCHTSTVGQPDYCSVGCKCDVAEADCDSDAECMDGLLCFHNVGNSYGYPNPITDVCDRSCPDGTINGLETDMDCGGSAFCPGCADGLICGVDTDCANNDCRGGICISCVDTLLNGDESDVDCGGPDCPGCVDGLNCNDGTDCASGRCDTGTCASCSDGIMSGGELGVDCGGPCPACLTDNLIISEYIEGSSNNKAVEIYNLHSAAVNLAGCAILVYYNGSASAGSTIGLNDTDLAAGGTWVLCNSSWALGSQCDQTSGSVNFNGDDAVELYCDSATIDVIGQIGTDPGSEWGSGVQSTQDNTIRRMASVCAGDTDGSDAFDPSSEWDGYAQNNVDDLGSHTESCP